MYLQKGDKKIQVKTKSNQNQLSSEKRMRRNIKTKWRNKEEGES